MFVLKNSPSSKLTGVCIYFFNKLNKNIPKMYNSEVTGENLENYKTKTGNHQFM